MVVADSKLHRRTSSQSSGDSDYLLASRDGFSTALNTSTHDAAFTTDVEDEKHLLSEAKREPAEEDEDEQFIMQVAGEPRPVSAEEKAAIDRGKRKRQKQGFASEMIFQVSMSAWLSYAALTTRRLYLCFC